MARRPPTTAQELRDAFTTFFAEREHSIVDSASLIPHDPTVLFTVAGMVPFKPFFVGDETPPYKRAATVQKCARAGGKHNDLDDVGRTKRHLVFFEMLGNFSFGDYFKESAIPWSWELVTERFGFDGDRIWITVHESDDEAESIWHEEVGVPMERIQRLGDRDNFWQMGETGPCGPCSELHIDRGAYFGPDGGPLHDPHGDRFMEFWNLVFMQFNQGVDGVRTPLPKPSIDTGAGLERILALIQGVDSVWETDALYPLVERAQSLTGTTYRTGDYEDRASFSLRVLAEHARSSAMLIADGVFPSNEGRGYVLRRIIRRAIRHAYLLGTDKTVMPELASTAIDLCRAAYPGTASQKDFVLDVLAREEERFRQTLKTGVSILDQEIQLVPSGGVLSGATAFLLHDTYGFPLEVTEEIVAERGLGVDRVGFDVEMEAQRSRAKAARRTERTDDEIVEQYRRLAEEHGSTDFVGYESDETLARVIGVVEGPDSVDVFLDRTPFYAESGGQVGDTGRLTADGLDWEVLDTTFAIPGLRRHRCRPIRGDLGVGDEVRASIDATRRSAIRRHHTATHILHWALREVLGDHVKQAGSLVDETRLRFDFSHYSPLTSEEIETIERLANQQTLSNTAVSAYETTKDAALAEGAIAFFGDKYGDSVRVLRAGDSFELCGGTHVSATGDIGIVKIVSEGSIGANLRRIEAVAGERTLRLLQERTGVLANIGALVGSSLDEVESGVMRRLDDLKSAQDDIKKLRSSLAAGRAADIAGTAVDGHVVERIDGLDPGDLRDLAIAVRQRPGVLSVVLGGVTPSGGVALVAAVSDGRQAGPLIGPAAKLVGGGGGGKGDIATAGGKVPEKLDEALELVRSTIAIAG
jgi:alanyl-tRNA synthetase